MNKITRKEAKDLGLDFEALIGDFICDSYQEHRRGANFFTKSIIKIDEKWFPEPQYRKFDGFWETNTYIWDDNSGIEWGDINELIKVEKKERIITETYWEEVK